MDLRALARNRVVWLVLGVVAYVAAAVAVLAVVVWVSLGPAQRSALADVVVASAATFVLGGVLATAGLVVLLVRGLGAYPRTAGRLAGDVRLLLTANADHRLEPAGPPELADLAAVVNELAERRAAVEREVAAEVAAARADLEAERDRLAALMADLTVAVLVCSLGGRVLLYNSAARELLGDDPALGLGRSVFGVVDRALVTHALDRIADGSQRGHVATVLRGDALLQVRVAPVRAGPAGLTGFVLVLEDTSQLAARRRRAALVRGLTEGTRAALASIRAAVETLLDYPEMEPDDRVRFLEIIHEEAQRLGGRVEGWAAEAATLPSDWALSDIAADDLLTVLCREVERGAGVPVRPGDAAENVWLQVDSHAVARALTQVVTRLRNECRIERLTLSLTRAGRHGRLDAAWRGRPADADALRRWLDEPLPGGTAASAREVLERHDAESWSGTGADGTPFLRVLLPVMDGAPRPPAQGPLEVASRPEFYDFDLFDLPESSLAESDRPLADLAYTVFDTETTGFHPDQGDEIVAVGAVHVVGGRLLRHEVFERLVDPQRAVPEASSAVHGITTEMVAGQPPLEEVLPAFVRFAEDMVLVGHNVGFDLSFLRAREARTGVRLGQPVLDTLLLDAAIHPHHERHSLEAIAARLGVDMIGRHTALGDALLTGEVFVRLLPLLQAHGIATLGEALAASRATQQARLDAALYGRRD